MTLTNFDFRSTHFEIKAPTKINKYPDFEALTKLYDEIKRCAQNVPSNNGGGNYGHLGLVVPATDYQLVSVVPFIRPNNPGDFVIPQHPVAGQNYTADEIKVMKDIHDDQLREYHTVQQVENALKQYIVEAVQPDYLLDLRNPLTGKLEGTVVYLMTQLFATYAKITAQSVLEKHTALINTNYDPYSPISKIFAKAQEYQKYASAFGDRITAKQLMTIVYNILRKTGKFNSALQKWNEKSEADKTWDNFKQHFREASTVLKEFEPTTTGDAGYANQIAEDVTKNLANLIHSTGNSEDQQAATEFMMNMTNAVNYNQQLLPQLFSSMSQMNDNISALQNNMQAMNLANAARNQTKPMQQPAAPPGFSSPPMQPSFQQMPPPPPPQMSQPFPPNANQQQMPPFCQPVNPNYQFQQQRQNYNNQPNPFQNNNQGGRGGGRGFGQGFGRGNGRQGRGNQSQKFYCWSHGVCGHPGVQCMTPNQGHQPFATFQNPMNGSMKGMMKYFNQA